MSHAGLIWANLRRRRLHAVMTFTSVMLGFMLYGLSLGLAEGFRRAALEQQAALPQQFLHGAVLLSAAGMALILILVTNAMAHAVRLRLQEFGLLKALGFSHQRIIGLVVAEAIVSVLAGAVSGLVGARLLFAALAGLLPALAAFPAPAYTLAMLAIAGAVALLIAALSTVVPALRIIQLDTAAVLTGSFLAPPARHDGERLQKRDPAAIRSTTTTREVLATTGLDLRLLRQVVIVARIGLSTLRQRIKGAVVIVASVGMMVFVLLSILALGEGIRAGMLKGTDPSRVVLRPASTTWLQKARLPDGIAALAAATPGVARASNGTPLTEAATYASNGYSTLVGVGPLWTEIMPNFRLLTGRMPRPGTREVIAGPHPLGKFSSLDSGLVRYGVEEWRIVGTFVTDSWWDGFFIGSAADVRSSARPPADSAVFVKLTEAEAFESFRESLASRLPAGVSIEREPDFYAAHWRSLPKSAIYFAILLTGVFGMGAAISLAHVMNAALQERSREIATLRVLGFSGTAVAASVVIEGMMFATLGALIGTSLAWAWVDGYLYNGAWTVFEVTVNLRLLLIGTGLALAVALIGTIPIAARMVRRREIDATSLRAVPGTTKPHIELDRFFPETPGVSAKWRAATLTPTQSSPAACR